MENEEGEQVGFEIGTIEKLTVEEDRRQQQQKGVGDENVLQFMDSLDKYLTLYDSLSATLCQGWLELASARHSMGSSRINTALLDLKFHEARTSLQLTQHYNSDDSMEQQQPHFGLRKWGDNGKACSEEEEDPNSKEDHSSTSQLRHRGNPHVSEKEITAKQAPLKVDDQVQKERSRSLSVFGTLVSPKLRAAQLSFETALETLVEIANVRSAMLSAFDGVHKELKVAREMR